jgi:GNAT superfamily N-acetyltransferase
VSDAHVRPAEERDLPAIAAIMIATDQHDEWGGGNPAYIRHLMAHGRVVMAELDGEAAGFGAVQRVGDGPHAVTMLCDLFVRPTLHGRGCGRAMLTELWAGASRKQTFSSQHAHAMPLYTSFGLDAWWPLLYLHGEVGRLPAPAGWTTESADAAQAARQERDWTGVDRAADYEAWAARDAAECVLVCCDDRVIAVGVVLRDGGDRGIMRLATSPSADDGAATAAVLATLARLDSPTARTQVCLPAPHPAVRPLLAAGWQFNEFDLFMATEPGLVDPRRAVPSSGSA